MKLGQIMSGHFSLDLVICGLCHFRAVYIRIDQVSSV